MNWRLIPITLAVMAALLAQGPGGHGPHRMVAKTDQVQSYLNLTDTQIQALKQLHESEMAAIKPIMQQMAPLHQSLRAQVQSGSADAATAGKLVLNVQSLQQQITATHASFRAQSIAVLTADQKTKLAALESAAALMPTIHQAMSLNLLARPETPEGGRPGAPQ
jgi:Spy/CpxP family protein refolding chaperone